VDIEQLGEWKNIPPMYAACIFWKKNLRKHLSCAKLTFPTNSYKINATGSTTGQMMSVEKCNGHW
jgi:hypothetical protein